MYLILNLKFKDYYAEDLYANDPYEKIGWRNNPYSPEVTIYQTQKEANEVISFLKNQYGKNYFCIISRKFATDYYYDILIKKNLNVPYI